MLHDLRSIKGQSINKLNITSNFTSTPNNDIRLTLSILSMQNYQLTHFELCVNYAD